MRTTPPLSTLDTLRRHGSIGTRTFRLRGLLAELANDAGVGVLAGTVGWENSTGCGTFDFTGCQEENNARFLLGVLGAAAGGTMGWNIGRRPRDVWQRVPSSAWASP